MYVQQVYHICMQINNSLGLNVLTKFSDDITLRIVLADIILRRPVACREYAVTSSYSASKLSRCLPDHLRKVRGHRVTGVVLRNFVCP